MTTITIPIDVAEAAAEALGNFVSDHGWSDSDMQAMDNLDAYIARHKAIRAELAKPTNADPECTESSVDYWQQRGYLGSPGEWREACRLFRVRCSPEDIQRMAKLRAYIEDGLLIVSRPDNKPPTPAWHDAPEVAALKAELERTKNDYQRACGLVADMHAAAVGEMTGPRLGVVEDVAALKAERDAAIKDAERYRYLRGQKYWSEALEEAIDAAIAKAEGRKK